MADDLAPDLEVLFRIASAVQSRVRRASRSPRRADVVAMGASGTPTQEIDQVAEAEVLSKLESEGVDWNVVSEEIGLVRRGGEKTLVVDPVDGSHNALRMMPFATVSLALGKADLDGIELGVVQDLSRGTTYWAARGGGAFRNGQRLHTRKWDPRAELFFVNLGRHSTPRSVAMAGKGRRIRSLGCASLEMMMVAQGAADLYFFENEVGSRNLRVTDIAAAYRIVLEAGGAVTDADLRPVGQFPLEVTHRTSVFASGDPTLSRSASLEGYR